jgi:S1-C subfamily serine protease
MRPEDIPTRFEDLLPSEQQRIREAGNKLGHLAFSHCAGIVIAPPPGCRPGRLNTGSGFVLSLDGAHFLGTANHVVESWFQRTSDGEHLLFQAGGADIAPKGRVAWRDEVADVAFLRIDADEARRIGVQPYEALLGWPPPAPKIGDYIVFAGYPATERLHPDPGSVDFGCFSGLVSVTSSHKNHVICQFERDYWISHDGGPLPPFGADLRGLSGGPAMLMGKIAYPLVGVVVEHNSAFELMRVSLLASAPENLMGAV